MSEWRVWRENTDDAKIELIKYNLVKKRITKTGTKRWDIE
jgi:hypothetical protein